MIHNFLNTITGIIYPPNCLLCKEKMHSLAVNGLICRGCVEKIRPNTPPFCPICGRFMPAGAESACASCNNTRFYFDRAMSACIYEAAAKEIIHRFKYSHKLKLGGVLSGLMINFIEEYRLPLSQCDYIIPIPLSPARLREREFNQSRILAQAVSRRFNISLLTDTLVRIRHTKPQADLHREMRFKNIKGAFGLRGKADIKDKTILLIDDILTTGSTVSEAAHTLKAARAKAVFVLTAAS